MQVKRHSIIWPLLFLVFGLLLLLCTPAHAITEDEVLAQVDAAGKEAVAGNVLVWFLCAVAFLKVSQKIDSFMASIGVNVGHTGGSMLSDVLIVTRALSAAVGAAGRSFGGKGSSSSGSAGGARAGERTSGGPFQGGLAGIVSRAVNNSAIKTATENKAYSGSVQSDMAREAVNAAASGKATPTTNSSSSFSSSTRSTSQQSASAQSAPSAVNPQSNIYGSGFSAEASGDMPVGAASVASDSISINEAEDESELHPIPQSDPGISISAAPNEATDTPEAENASPALSATSMAGGIRTSHNESDSRTAESSSVSVPQQNASSSQIGGAPEEAPVPPITASAGVNETVQQAASASTEQPPIGVPGDVSTVVTDGPDGSESGGAGSPVIPVSGGAQGIASESVKQSESVVSEQAAVGKPGEQNGAGLHSGERTESVTIPVTNNPTNTIKAQVSGTPGSRPAAAGGSEAVVSKSSQATHSSSTKTSVQSERVHGYGIGGAMFMRSLASGGSFANNIIGKVATGSVQNTGTISGDMASQVLTSYMGYTAIGSPPETTPKFTDVEIGGGRITGIETAPGGGQSIQFAMYHTNQYDAPRGDFTKVVSADGETWYKQYAQDTVERTPYKAPDNTVAYNETIVQRMPEPPRRKDRN